MSSNRSLGEERIRHLELIQSAIMRLATNSFLLKGWALTVTGAVDAYSAKLLQAEVASIGVAVPLVFWFLDTYFLRQERLFRRLYDDVRQVDSAVDAFSMSVTAYLTRLDWWNAARSITLSVFYGVMVIAGIALVVVAV